MIVRKPDVNRREVLETGELDVDEGLVGDNWRSSGSGETMDGSAHPETQLNLMNSRAIALVSQSEGRWALARDQFFVDLDLGKKLCLRGINAKVVKSGQVAAGDMIRRLA